MVKLILSQFVLELAGKDKKGVLLQEGSASQGPGSALQPSQSRMLAAAAAGFVAQLCILCENKVGRETLPVLVALTWEFDNDVYFKIQTNLKPLHHRYTYSFL